MHQNVSILSMVLRDFMWSYAESRQGNIKILNLLCTPVWVS